VCPAFGIAIRIILNPVGEIVNVTRAFFLKVPAFLFVQLNREEKDGGGAAFHFEEETSLVGFQKSVVAGGIDEFLHW